MSCLIRTFFILAVVLLLSSHPSSAQEPNETPAGPRIEAVFPRGGQQGTSFEVEIRGQQLQGAYALWFDCPTLRAYDFRVEEVELAEPEKQGSEEEEKKEANYRVLVQMDLGATAKVGAHALRLVSPGEISNPVAFQVNPERNILETDTPHGTPGEAQEVRFPGIVNGRIDEKGERDYYAIRVSKNQELLFEVLTGSGLLLTNFGTFFPQLNLYEPTGSWFDPAQVTRLESRNESIFFIFPKGTYVTQYLPRLTHRFSKPGRYLVEVAAFEGEGGAALTYQLRIAKTRSATTPRQQDWTPRVLAHADGPDWLDRDFDRTLTPDRLSRLWARSVRLPLRAREDSPGGGGSSNSPATTGKDGPGDQPAEGMDLSGFAPVLTSVLEKEPNESVDLALEVTVPIIVEGAVERPGDVDHFKFKVEAEQSLAFEVETPNSRYPHFAPRLGVTDSHGQEILTNIYRKVAGDGDDWVKSIEPKTVHSFKRGEYYLQVRDLTSRKGNHSFRYRVLIRSRIPHMGRVVPKIFGIVGIETEEDRINLVAGETHKLVVVSAQEEGFDGEIALNIENLPPGVRAFPTAGYHRPINSQAGQVYEERGAIQRERFRPERQLTMITLEASQDAPLTRVPSLIRLTARPILQKRPGTAHPVYVMPLMVVRPSQAELASGKPEETRE